MCNGNKKNIISNIKDKDKKALLLGNGIFLSCPSKGEQFKFSFQDLKEDLIQIYQENYQDKEKDIDCPEELLSLFNIELSLEILKYYKKKFNNFCPALTDLRSFVQKFSNIYTTNYDPITYRSIFQENQENGKKTAFSDGLDPNKDLCIESIKKRLENNKCIYYLHGAFHIIKNHKNDTYKKLKAGRNEKLMDAIEKKSDDIVRQWRKKPDELQEVFTVVLEAESHYKQVKIERGPYLKFCRDQLSKENKVLSIGCSFKKDEHLLETILLNPNLESFEIGIYDKNDKENVEEACECIEKRLLEKVKSTFKCNKEKKKFICTRDLDKLIWPNQNPSPKN